MTGMRSLLDAIPTLLHRTPPPGSTVILAIRNNKPAYPVIVNTPALFDDLAALMRPCLGHSIDTVLIVHYGPEYPEGPDSTLAAPFTETGIPVLGTIRT